MLYRIIEADRFAACMDHVKRALWPEDRFFALRDRLPGEQPGETEDKVLETTAAALKTIAETVAAEPHYVAINEAGGVSTLPLPFRVRRCPRPDHTGEAGPTALHRGPVPGATGRAGHPAHHLPLWKERRLGTSAPQERR